LTALINLLHSLYTR